ncbi:TIGR03083 family protein [Nonomuraea maritima]|uniref:TIGR03083 family protein n=1 Tax=Nonomuraea maritima TaxID=683260 RepID=A0A1G8WTI9_9ACTN|nr:maleylpyruvate isomerase family mycothiol-dependent enzyme [Nonomuraea maritima]SDJ81367.1 TIGR03083 family protein [Nonomuraea maritima]
MMAEDLQEQTAALARAAVAGDPDATVPTCPEWRLRDLVAHIEQALRWAAELVRAAAPLPIPDPRAADPGAIGGWERRLADGAEELIEAVRDAPGDARVWSVLGPVPPAFWLRRMLSDVTVHRYDAAATTGAGFEISPRLAADVIGEGMELLSAPEAEAFKPDLVELRGTGERLAVRPHAMDGWLVTRTPDGIRVARGNAGADVTVSGPVTELMLVLTGRVPPAEGGVAGDRGLLDHWLACTRF